MLGAALTTAATRAATRPSAPTRSRSTWSMTAMSPGCSRFVSRLVRRSSRAIPTTPGCRSPERGRRKVASFIRGESARPLHCAFRAAPLAGFRLASGLALGLRRSGDGEKFLGVAATQLGVRQSGQHARKLLEALLPVHGHHVGGRRSPGLGLTYYEVVVGKCRDLGQ